MLLVSLVLACAPPPAPSGPTDVPEPAAPLASAPPATDAALAALVGTTDAPASVGAGDAPAAATEVPPCAGALEGFSWSWWSGHVGPGHVETHTVEGTVRGESITVRYRWHGDIRTDVSGTYAKGELAWEGPVDASEGWRELLAAPVYAVRAPDPRSTGGHEERLSLRYAGGCTRDGQPGDTGWRTRAGALRAQAGADLPFDQRVAYGLATDRVRLTVMGADAVLRLTYTCPDGTRGTGSVTKGSGSFALPADGCALRFPGLEGAVDGVDRGDRLACAVVGGAVTCRPGE